MSRTCCFTAVCAVVVAISTHVRAADTSAAGSRQHNNASRYDAVGRLQVNPKAATRKNAPPYVLVDKSGRPRCYLTPDANVDVADFVNQRIGVRGMVNSIDGDSMPNILARGVRPVEESTGQAANKPVKSDVAPAKHVEPAAASEELPTPSPQPDPRFSGGDVIDGGTITEGAVMDGQAGPVFEGEPGAMMQGHDDCHGGQCGHPNCPGESCAACMVCCCMANDPGMWWVRAEYLAWATKGMYIPPLVTTGPNATNPGILGEQGTEILFGDETINDSVRSGGRISFGRWLDPCQNWGIGGEYFALEDESTNFFAEGDEDGNPIISRPYFTVFGFNPDDTLKEPGENAELVSLPDVVTGSVDVQTNTSFQGAGAWLRYNICCKNVCWPECFACCDPCSNPCGGTPGGVRIGLIGGYRFMRLSDTVSITEDLTSLDEEDPGDFLLNDSFRTRNKFNGVELGTVLDLRKARWTMELMAKLAIGSTRQTVEIDGSTIITNSEVDNGTYVGGLLAQSTNIGTYNRNRFSMIPQLNANLGYNVTPQLRVLVGYTLIYWSNVVRAGEQISLDVNETYIPPNDTPEGPARPAFAWRSNDFWAQGINVGVDYRF